VEDARPYFHTKQLQCFARQSNNQTRQINNLAKAVKGFLPICKRTDSKPYQQTPDSEFNTPVIMLHRALNNKNPQLLYFKEMRCFDTYLLFFLFSLLQLQEMKSIGKKMHMNLTRHFMPIN